MKKSLLAIAIATTVPAIASAQITIGGLMDISVANVDNGAKSKLVTSTGDRSSNNINFTGVEKIGDLSGFFHAEFGFDVDNGTFNGAAATTSATTGNKDWGVVTAATDFAKTTTNTDHGATGHAHAGCRGRCCGCTVKCTVVDVESEFSVEKTAEVTN
ncbi:MAG: porin, partial [Betaproteobacteria bacterium]|nr:porin [Betaproteobacteria bacterium]